MTGNPKPETAEYLAAALQQQANVKGAMEKEGQATKMMAGMVQLEMQVRKHRLLDGSTLSCSFSCR